MELNAVAFDFETIANPTVIPLLPPVEPRGNLKDPVKIEADIQQKKEKQIADLALDPWTSLICATGWCDGKESGVIMLEDEEKESDLINKTWDLLAQYNHYVTFNGVAFDVPMLNKHSLVNRIRCGIKINTKRYTIGNHTDLRMILGDWDKTAKGKLGFFLRLFFGTDKKEGIDGKLVQSYWDAGEHDDIAEYCKDDAEKTWRLYEHVSRYYM